MAYETDTDLGGEGKRFPQTRPSLLEQAAARGESGRRALDSVIGLYWKPAYKHVRIRWRKKNEEAKDLVQSFFAMLVEENLLSQYDSEKGRLRTWLCACLDRFVLREAESASRLKRGGGAEFTFDFDAAEKELAATTPTPEDVFLREWEREVFALALEDFGLLCESSGKHLQRRIFEQYDLAESSRPAYADLAREHGIPVTAVTNHLAWARRELRRLVRRRMDAE